MNIIVNVSMKDNRNKRLVVYVLQCLKIEFPDVSLMLWEFEDL